MAEVFHARYFSKAVTAGNIFNSCRRGNSQYHRYRTKGFLGLRNAFPPSVKALHTIKVEEKSNPQDILEGWASLVGAHAIKANEETTEPLNETTSWERQEPQVGWDFLGKETGDEVGDAGQADLIKTSISSNEEPPLETFTTTSTQSSEHIDLPSSERDITHPDRPAHYEQPDKNAQAYWRAQKKLKTATRQIEVLMERLQTQEEQINKNKLSLAQRRTEEEIHRKHHMEPQKKTSQRELLKAKADAARWKTIYENDMELQRKVALEVREKEVALKEEIVLLKYENVDLHRRLASKGRSDASYNGHVRKHTSHTRNTEADEGRDSSYNGSTRITLPQPRNTEANEGFRKSQARRDTPHYDSYRNTKMDKRNIPEKSARLQDPLKSQARRGSSRSTNMDEGLLESQATRSELSYHDPSRNTEVHEDLLETWGEKGPDALSNVSSHNSSSGVSSQNSLLHDGSTPNTASNPRNTEAYEDLLETWGEKTPDALSDHTSHNGSTRNTASNSRNTEAYEDLLETWGEKTPDALSDLQTRIHLPSKR